MNTIFALFKICLNVFLNMLLSKKTVKKGRTTTSHYKNAHPHEAINRLKNVVKQEFTIRNGVQHSMGEVHFILHVHKMSQNVRILC